MRVQHLPSLTSSLVTIKTNSTEKIVFHLSAYRLSFLATCLGLESDYLNVCLDFKSFRKRTISSFYHKTSVIQGAAYCDLQLPQANYVLNLQNIKSGN